MRREREEQSRRAAFGATEADPERSDLADYREVGPPPTGALGRVTHAQRLASVALWRAAIDPTIDERERRKVIKELAAVVGLNHARAHVEERLHEIGKRLGMVVQPDDELDDYPTDVPMRVRPGSRGR
jgi:hypothetical protein